MAEAAQRRERPNEVWIFYKYKSEGYEEGKGGVGQASSGEERKGACR